MNSSIYNFRNIIILLVAVVVFYFVFNLLYFCIGRMLWQTRIGIAKINKSDQFESTWPNPIHYSLYYSFELVLFITGWVNTSLLFTFSSYDNDDDDDNEAIWFWISISISIDSDSNSNSNSETVVVGVDCIAVLIPNYYDNYQRYWWW